MSPVQLGLYRATVEHNYNKLQGKTEEVRQIDAAICLNYIISLLLSGEEWVSGSVYSETPI
jgi:hypothetical protein